MLMGYSMASCRYCPPKWMSINWEWYRCSMTWYNLIVVSLLQTEPVRIMMSSPPALEELQERSLHTIFSILTDELPSPQFESLAISFLSVFIHDSMLFSCEVDRCSRITRLSAHIDVTARVDRFSLCIDNYRLYKYPIRKKKHQWQGCQNVKVESSEMFVRPWWHFYLIWYFQKLNAIQRTLVMRWFVVELYRLSANCCHQALIFQMKQQLQFWIPWQL